MRHRRKHTRYASSGVHPLKCSGYRACWKKYMAWLGSKGVLARDVGLRQLTGRVHYVLYVGILFASHLGQSNRVDYTLFLVFGVICWCPRAYWNKCTMVTRQQGVRKECKGLVAWQGSCYYTIHCNPTRGEVVVRIICDLFSLFSCYVIN